MYVQTCPKRPERHSCGCCYRHTVADRIDDVDIELKETSLALKGYLFNEVGFNKVFAYLFIEWKCETTNLDMIMIIYWLN